MSYGDHNRDPNIPETLIDRGYNKENCERWKSKDSGDNGLWLGHKVGCQLDGFIYEEFDIKKAPTKVRA